MTPPKKQRLKRLAQQNILRHQKEKIVEGRYTGISEEAILKATSNPPKRKNKFNAKKITVEGIRFDSKKEASRYIVLKQMEKDGSIRGLDLQVKYDLTVNDEKVCKYVADFVYEKYDYPHDASSGKKLSIPMWLLVVEDVKSPATRKLPVYRLKKKLMKAVHGIEIKEV